MPNAITLGSLLIGLGAIAEAFAQHYIDAAWLIVLCVLLDKLDGTAARALRATSFIGTQLDSFSDFLTFGIAPALLVFARLQADPTGAGDVWATPETKILMAVLLATFVVCCVIRLAKFNVLDQTLPADGPKVFYGLPSTFAGGLVAIVFILGAEHDHEAIIRWLPLGAAALGGLMVANLPLPKLGVREALWLNIFQAVNIALGYVCGLFRFWPEYILGAVLLYAVVGFTWGIIHRHELMPKHLDPYPR